MGQASRELRKMWRNRYRDLLDSIFDECASHKIIIGPDDAMDWMEDFLQKLASDDEQLQLDETVSRPVSNLRFDVPAYRREAHHYAVDRFYKTYFPRKRGAPPLPEAYVDRILQLRFQKLNYISIAERLGEPKGRVKKQVRAAEKRWQEAVARIEQITLRSPHLVAAAPVAQVRKQRTPGLQSKRQNVKPLTGK